MGGIRLSCILLLLGYVRAAWAEPDQWIYFRSIGTGIHHYAGQARKYIDHYETEGNNHRLTLHFDSLGFYRQIQDLPWIVGGLLNSSIDRIRSPHSIVYIGRFRISASSQYFFGQTTGRGFFLRGDASLIRSLIAHDPFFHPEYQWGLGMLLGSGYGIPVFGDRSLLFQFNYSPDWIDGAFESSLGINIGLMF